jgi:transcription-repair coupling factor (superfamily II helicase)
VIVTFVARPPFEPIKLIQMIQKDGRFRLAGQDRVRIEWPTNTLDERLALIREFLKRLQRAPRPSAGRRQDPCRCRRRCMCSSATGCRRTTFC